MQQALGWLRWPPDAFWGATLAEVHSAITGFLETRGEKPRDPDPSGWGEIIEQAREARRQERWAEQAG